MKIIAALSLVCLLAVAPAFAQLGPGAAPPLSAQPDKLPALSWNASTSSGVTYNVYRGTVAGGPKGRVNTAPVAPTNFRDTTAQFGVQNFYTVTSQRTSDGVESVQSNEASATAIQGSPAPPTGFNVVLAIFVKLGKTIFAGLKVFGRFFA